MKKWLVTDARFHPQKPFFHLALRDQNDLFISLPRPLHTYSIQHCLPQHNLYRVERERNH
jgi:hypothetical protein